MGRKRNKYKKPHKRLWSRVNVGRQCDRRSCHFTTADPVEQRSKYAAIPELGDYQSFSHYSKRCDSGLSMLDSDNAASSDSTVDSNDISFRPERVTKTYPVKHKEPKQNGKINTHSGSNDTCKKSLTPNSNLPSYAPTLEDEDDRETSLLATATNIRNVQEAQREIDEHALSVEYVRSIGEDDNVEHLENRRIVDIAYFSNACRKLEDHREECTANPRGYLSYLREKRHGLGSTFIYKCHSCSYERKIKTIENPDDVNAAAVIAMYSVGKGHDHLEEILTTLAVPAPAYNTFRKREGEVGDALIEALNEEIQKAGEEEREIAIQKGNFISVGKKKVPFIIVIVDGAWSHRSYNHRYKALCGCAVIVGLETKKILFLGLRNKYCSICSIAMKRKKIIPDHTCYKNWDKSSTSMEPSIITEGFCASEEMHGVRYLTVIADGDSSVLTDIIENVPYGRDVIKIECVNHLMKNVNKRLHELGDTLTGQEKKFFDESKLSRLTAYTRNIIQKCSENGADHLTMVGALKHVGFHCIGDHTKCAEEFCSKSGSLEQADVDSQLAVEISKIIFQLTNNTSSLLENKTTNLAEFLFHLVTKLTGSKQAFYGKRDSWNNRVRGAGLLYQRGQEWRSTLWKHRGKKTAPNLFDKLARKRTNRNILRSRRRELENERKKLADSSSTSDDNDYNVYLAGPSSGETEDEEERRDPGADYGLQCNRPDVSPELLEENKALILATLAVDEEKRNKIERATVGQAANHRWYSERKNRLTASNFGSVFKRTRAPAGTLVKRILYPGKLNTPSIRYGRNKEIEAIADFEKYRKKTVKACGLFVDRQRGFLAASPDGLIEAEEAIVEIKCPYSLRSKTPWQAAEKKVAGFCLEIVNNKLRLKPKHDYMFQIQGQLAITGFNLCYFIVWTPLKHPSGEPIMHVEKIKFDQNKWESTLKILEDFYLQEMLPEIADPRLARKLPLRNSAPKTVTKDKTLGTNSSKEKKSAATEENNDPEYVSHQSETEESVIIIVDSDESIHSDEIPFIDDFHLLQQSPAFEDKSIQQSVCFLRNAHLLGSLKINGEDIYISNTCAFDSLVSIIVAMMHDNRHYKEILQQQPQNRMTEFCFMVAQEEEMNKIYLQRGRILLAAPHSVINTADGINYSCECNVSQICSMFDTTPSAYRLDRCLNPICNFSCTRKLTFIDLSLDYEENLKNLPQILTSYCELQTNIRCNKCQTFQKNSRVEIGMHIFLMVESLKRGFSADSIEGSFKIDDLPLEVMIECERYTLAGVIVCYGNITPESKKQGTNHYVAYVRRRNSWEAYSDTANEVTKNPRTSEEVNPHLIVYIQG